jgi:hypothetical protein
MVLSTHALHRKARGIARAVSYQAATRAALARLRSDESSTPAAEARARGFEIPAAGGPLGAKSALKAGTVVGPLEGEACSVAAVVEALMAEDPAYAEGLGTTHTLAVVDSTGEQWLRFQHGQHLLAHLAAAETPNTVVKTINGKMKVCLSVDVVAGGTITLPAASEEVQFFADDASVLDFLTKKGLVPLGDVSGAEGVAPLGASAAGCSPNTMSLRGWRPLAGRRCALSHGIDVWGCRGGSVGLGRGETMGSGQRPQARVHPARDGGGRASASGAGGGVSQGGGGPPLRASDRSHMLGSSWLRTDRRR